MKYLDRILEFLRDSQWHSIMSLEMEITLPYEKLNTKLFFLQKYGFIENEYEKMKITPLGLRFLEL